MKFEDLTVFDLNLIKSQAIELLVFSRISNRYEALANVVISCINSKGYDLVDMPKDIVPKIVNHMTPGFGYGSTKSEDTPDEVVKKIIEFLEKHGTKFVLSNREPTWSKPNSSWYTPYDNTKKPWVM